MNKVANKTEFGCISLILALFLIIALGGENVFAQSGEGYDENTEVTVKGTVAEVVEGARGPVMLKFSFRDRVYTVVTGPPWYLVKEGIVFRKGDELEITGSKYFGEKGTIFVIARTIKDRNSGKEYPLRDYNCRPMWRGMRNR